MPLGTFTLVIDGEQIGERPETTATLRLRVQGRDSILDRDADLIYFPHLSAVKGASIGLPYTVLLPTDVASGSSAQSTEIGYEVTVTTRHGGSIRSSFAARAAGSTVNLVDLVETVVIPVADSLRYRDEAEAARDEAVAAANAAEAVGTTNDTVIAGRINDSASATRAALSATYARRAGVVYLDNYRGAGVSDTTALLNAVAAAAGRTLVLGSMSLTVEDVIEVTADNVTIDARGASVTLVDDGTATGRIIRFRDCERPAWIGGTIAQTAASRTGLYGLLTADNVLDLLVDRVNLIGGSSTSFFGEQLDGFHLRGLRCRNPKADGIHISRGSRDGHIDSPLIVAAQDDAIGIVSIVSDPDGPTYTQIENIAISNPVVRDLVTLGSGIALVGPRYVTVTGGIVDNPVDAGVKISDDTVAGTHLPSNITVTGTQVRDCTDSFRIGNATDVTMSNVVGLNGSGLGFLLSGATRAHIVGGRMRGHVDAGVFSTGGADNNLIGVDLRGNASPSVGAAHTLTSCITA